jgi:hypothetical protein
VEDVIVSVLRSVARRRLVETGNRSVCATVNCKSWRATIALYLHVIKRTCNQGANESNHPNYNPSFRHAYHSTRDNIDFT